MMRVARGVVLGLGLGLVVVGACKGKAGEREREKEKERERESEKAADKAAGSGTGTGTGTGTGAPAVPAPPPPMPSETLIAGVPGGPMRSADGARVVWCTRADNGMAAWVEVQCHVGAPGKKPTVIPVMTYADAMAVDEGADPAGDADAGVKASDARGRIEAGVAKLAADGGADLVAMPAPVRCTFQGGALVGRDDGGAATGCDVGGVTAHITAPGKVTLTSADRSLVSEVHKARPRGKNAAGDECYLEASSVELSVDPQARLVAAAIGLASPSDACALVTEYEVRVVALP